MIREDVSRAVRSCAAAALAAGELPTARLPAGVNALAMWRNERFGSVLFFAEPTAGLFPFDYPSLYHEDAKLRPMIRRWLGTGGGGIGVHEPVEQLIAAVRPVFITSEAAQIVPSASRSVTPPQRLRRYA